jgi:hypothetical protein
VRRARRCPVCRGQLRLHRGGRTAERANAPRATLTDIKTAASRPDMSSVRRGEPGRRKGKWSVRVGGVAEHAEYPQRSPPIPATPIPTRHAAAGSTRPAIRPPPVSSRSMRPTAQRALTPRQDADQAKDRWTDRTRRARACVPKVSEQRLAPIQNDLKTDIHRSGATNAPRLHRRPRPTTPCRSTHPHTHPSGAPGIIDAPALIAQGIEHRFPKPGVVGSNPTGGTSYR